MKISNLLIIFTSKLGKTLSFTTLSPSRNACGTQESQPPTRATALPDHFRAHGEQDAVAAYSPPDSQTRGSRGTLLASRLGIFCSVYWISARSMRSAVPSLANEGRESGSKYTGMLF